MAVYRAVLTLAWFAGTIYATIPLFSLVVRPLAKLLRACAFTIAGSDPVLVHYDGSHLFHDLAVARGRSLPRATCLGGLGLIVRYRHCYLSPLALGFSHVSLVGRSGRDPRQGRRLVTSGIRQQIRHPIYLAHLCMLLAWTVGSGGIVLYGLTICALLTGWPMIRQEEAELESRFGDEYRAYRRAVPAARPR